MGHMSNKFIETTEAVIKQLGLEDTDKLFDDIQNFISENGDLIYESPVYIAAEYKKYLAEQK